MVLQTSANGYKIISSNKLYQSNAKVDLVIWAASIWSLLQKYEKQPNTKVLQIQLEAFLTNRRRNLCQITAHISPVMCSLLSLDYLNRFSRSSHRRCSVKKAFLKTLQISQENTCGGVSCNKVEGQQLYEKRDSNTDIFL